MSSMSKLQRQYSAFRLVMFIGIVAYLVVSFTSTFLSIKSPANAAIPAGARCFQEIQHSTVTDAMKTIDCNDPSAATILEFFANTGNIPPNPCIVFSGGNGGSLLGSLPSVWDCARVDAKVAETQAAGNPSGPAPRCISLAQDKSLANEQPCNSGFRVEGQTFTPTAGQCYTISTITGGHKAESFNCSEFDERLKKAKEEAEQIQKAKSEGKVIQAGQPTACRINRNFFIPTWYQYLPVDDNCAVKIDFKTNPGQIWLIGLAIADILLRLAGLITVFVIISGGYKYMTSQFDPEGTKKAKDTVLNGLIGLVIVTLATAIVNLVGNTLR